MRMERFAISGLAGLSAAVLVGATGARAEYVATGPFEAMTCEWVFLCRYEPVNGMKGPRGLLYPISPSFSRVDHVANGFCTVEVKGSLYSQIFYAATGRSLKLYWVQDGKPVKRVDARSITFPCRKR